MTDKPLRLIPKETKFRDGVLETLKNTQRTIEENSIIGIAVAMVDKEGFSYSLYEPGENMGLLIGSVERLKYRILKHQNGD